MRRLVWLALGVSVGVLVVRVLFKAGQRGSLSEWGNNLSAAARDFAADVREAMHEQEILLRAGAGLDGQLGAVPEPKTPQEYMPQGDTETP